MNNRTSRRSLLGRFVALATGVLVAPLVRTARAAVKGFVATGAPKNYDVSKHKWLQCIDIDKCIGCGLCAEACKTENHVPAVPTYFRTWIERYIIKKPAPGAAEMRGEVLVDSPNGGIGGFPQPLVPREEILKSFYVPKLCNLCEHSACTQACPVGATFDAPDGAVLINPHYCIGCGFCIQACPYGCRFISPVTHTAEKCTLCYHRITRGLRPACVEICPTEARIFGDLKNLKPDDALQRFIEKNKVQTLKPHLGTEPRVLYAGMDKEVRYMIPVLAEALSEAVPHFDGFVYPNEIRLLWSVLIVIYPYVTGLVAGAFILASLVKVFHVKALEPIYRFSLLTSFSFLLAAPLPLLFHLGHPERCFEVMMTPHASSPMAMFGFVYAWYLMAVLLLELWFDYRKDFVEWSKTERGIHGTIYRLFTLGVTNISPAALRLDERLGKIITIIGIPSAFLLHGYVGFIFGSIKANPWWGNVLMPIIFIFSAMVSGIALCVFLYMVITWGRRLSQNIECLDMMAKFLFYALVIDATIEGLDWIHRLYAADESIHVLKTLASGKLFYTLLVGQAFFGTLVPLLLLGLVQLVPRRIPALIRERLYIVSSVLILLGVFAMRWNVVVGGQLFSKSLRGFTTHKLELAGQEGWLMGLALILLPFFILAVLLKYFLPLKHVFQSHDESVPAATKV